MIYTLAWANLPPWTHSYYLSLSPKLKYKYSGPLVKMYKQLITILSYTEGDRWNYSQGHLHTVNAKLENKAFHYLLFKWEVTGRVELTWRAQQVSGQTSSTQNRDMASLAH